MFTWLRIKWLIGRLTSPNDRTRGAAAKSLVGIGAPAVRPLLAVLKLTKKPATKAMASDDPAALSDPIVNQFLAAHTALEKIQIRAELAQDLVTAKEIEEALATLSTSEPGGDSSDPWERAIAEAEAGQQEEAVEAFLRAFGRDPNYYISEIRPSSAAAVACWQKAVDQYTREADAKAAATSGSPTLCVHCGKDIGVGWHYGFESIAFAATVAAQCPQCCRLTCEDCLNFGPDGNYPPCPKCGVTLEVLSAGPAYSSMVEQAQRQRRYRGAVRPPSALGREVKQG